MLQNPNFPGLHPGPRWESLQRSLRPLTYGEWLTTPAKDLTSLSALLASFLCQMSFPSHNTPKSMSDGALPQTPLRELTARAPQIP